MVRGHLNVLQRQDVLGRVEQVPAAQAVLRALTEATSRLRDVGDAVDVDTRMLPVTWTLDLDWACPPKTPNKIQCFMPNCGRWIWENQIEEHTNMFTVCNPEVGVVPDDFND